MVQQAAVSPGVPSGIQAVLARELSPDERVIWAGRPRGRMSRPARLFLILFGLSFAAFSLIWIAAAVATTSASSNPVLGTFACLGIPFFAIGLLVVLMPVWVRRAAARTVYAITDRRALVVQATPFRSLQVRSFAPAQLGTIERNERRDGSGDLVFVRSIETFGTQGSVDLRTYPRGFLNIENVREVEQVLRANFGLG